MTLLHLFSTNDGIDRHQLLTGCLLLIDWHKMTYIRRRCSFDDVRLNVDFFCAVTCCLTIIIVFERCVISSLLHVQVQLPSICNKNETISNGNPQKLLTYN